MTPPGSTLPVIINHHRHQATGIAAPTVLQLAVTGEEIVVDVYDVGDEDPSRAIAEMLTLTAAAIHPQAAKEMLGLEINVTSHTTELVLSVKSDKQ